MKKMATVLILCSLMALLPVCALAWSPNPELPPGCPEFENYMVAQTVSGKRTAGICFIVHDVYFDGLQLQVSVTQVAEDPAYSVFEEDVYELDPEQNVFVLGKDLDFDKGQLGAYCQVTAYDGDHRMMYNAGGESSPAGKALVQTDYFNFTPARTQDTVHVVISCGVVETVLREDETPEWEDVEMDVPIQNPAVNRTVKITENESPLPIQEVFMTQTDQYTGVYIYYTRDDPDYPDPPFELVTDGLSEVIGEVLDDPDRGMPFDYHLLQTTQNLTTIRVVSRVTPGMVYDIDLQAGTITRGE